MRLNMILRTTGVYLWLLYFTTIDADLFSMEKLRNYAKYLDWNGVKLNSSDNELWNGLINDCSKTMTFSCIQKNAYAYLDNTFVDRDNITIFDGFVLRRNNIDYETMSKRSKIDNDIAENLVEASVNEEQLKSSIKDDKGPEAKTKAKVESVKSDSREYETPLEEITGALRDKAIKFLLTRDYELQLPHFFFEDSTVKISPREIDEKGALIRVEIGQRGLETQGRLFKKIKKFIQNKLLVSFFALILIIKLIKIKFLFVIPFLFGVGAAKKLFLKLLLFLVPAFAHVFKLCSSYYSSRGHHHHHHQIAHHHHHVPVPVPVPTYYGPNHHHPHNGEEHGGYEYSHPHIQLRKDIEELKEWGIKPMDDPYDDHEDGFGIHTIRGQVPLSPVYHANSFAAPQHVPLPRPTSAPSYPPKYPGGISTHAQSLAYNGYLDEHPKFNRRISVQSPVAATTISHVSQVPASPINIQLPALSSVNVVASNVPTPAVNPNSKTPYNVYPQHQKVNGPQQAIVQYVSKPAQQVLNQKILPQSQAPGNSSPSVGSALAHQSNNYAVAYDDSFYGPILERLDDTFAQLRFSEENCRERLLCSMYKNPTQYSPHSNLVSNELSRDPEELKRGDTGSNSSRRFFRYVSAARLGQDNGDCLRTYPCQINTE